MTQSHCDATLSYLSVAEAAEHLGLTRQAFNAAKPPRPAATIGRIKGWTVEQLDAWDRTRRSPGRYPTSKSGPYPIKSPIDFSSLVPSLDLSRFAGVSMRKAYMQAMPGSLIRDFNLHALGPAGATGIFRLGGTIDPPLAGALTLNTGINFPGAGAKYLPKIYSDAVLGPRTKLNLQFAFSGLAPRGLFPEALIDSSLDSVVQAIDDDEVQAEGLKGLVENYEAADPGAVEELRAHNVPPSVIVGVSFLLAYAVYLAAAVGMGFEDPDEVLKGWMHELMVSLAMCGAHEIKEAISSGRSTRDEGEGDDGASSNPI